MGMFDDFFSSSRGPGVIGTMIALVVLVGFGSLYLFVFDEGFQGGGKSIHAVIRDQKSELDRLNSQIKYHEDAMARGKDFKQIAQDVETETRQLASHEKSLQELATVKAENEKLIEVTTKSWEDYKMQYRKAERGRAVGEKIPELVTKSGKTYKAVIIKSFDDRRMTIMSETGFNGIDWSDLPDEMSDRFQYTKELAQVKIASESADSQSMDKNTQAYHLTQDLESARITLNEEEAAFRSKTADVSQCQGRIDQHNREIARLNRLIAQEVNKSGLRETPRYRSQIQVLTDKIKSEQQKLASFATVKTAHEQTVQKQNARIKEITEKMNQLQQQK